MLIFDRDKFDLSKPLVRLETKISVTFLVFSFMLLKCGIKHFDSYYIMYGSYNTAHTVWSIQYAP